MRQLPVTTEALITELESLFPPRCIKPHESLEEAHRYAGRVDLVAELRASYTAALRKQTGIPKY
jgi:hypothetical protein